MGFIFEKDMLTELDTCVLVAEHKFTKEIRYIPMVGDKDTINWFGSKMKCLGIYRIK